MMGSVDHPDFEGQRFWYAVIIANSEGDAARYPAMIPVKIVWINNDLEYMQSVSGPAYVIVCDGKFVAQSNGDIMNIIHHNQINRSLTADEYALLVEFIMSDTLYTIPEE